MPSKRYSILNVICGLAIILLASCDSIEVYRLPKPHRGPGIGHGPPAHAKAHGYRRKQVCGYDLAYDSNWGVYVVVGVADCYYHDGHFYRFCGDRWQVSLRADSGWDPVTLNLLPPGLQKKSKARLHAKAQIKASPVGKIKAKGYAKHK